MKRRVEFWSSTEYTTFLPGLVTWLEERNVTAKQCFQVSQADYWAARERGDRFAMRARCYGLYPLRVGLKFLRRRNKPAVGVVCTNTFYAPWVALFASGTSGTPVVNWVFDLYPDVLTLAGKIKRGSLTGRVIASLVRSTFHHAAANVFLGEHLLAHARKRFGPIPRAHVIPVGADGTLFRHRLPKPRAADATATILYCGNLGRMHEFDTVAGAIRQGLPAGVRMDFRGNGAGFRALETSLESALGGNVSFGENLSREQWVETMSAAEVGLVTVRPGAEGLVMPSKTYSAMVAGQAILAICPSQSDLADTVRLHDAGWVVEPGDTAALQAALAQIAGEPAEVLRRRVNSFNAGQGIYDQVAIAGVWALLFDEVVDARAKKR